MSIIETNMNQNVSVEGNQAQLLVEIEAFNQNIDSLLQQLEHCRNTFTQSLLNRMERVDPGRAAHCRRVRRYAVITAHELGLDETQQQTIELASLLHDFGALDAPSSILQRQDALTAEERQVLRSYVYEGAKTLGKVHAFDQVVALICSHYEWFSGEGGFPGHLHGNNIPLGARIIAIANAYDALITRRPGYKPISSQDALMEISARTGTQYDPDVVEAFVRVV
ncbi:MAG: HD domain-containing phosphohydrolase [Chloroflexota bacterium]